MERRGNWRRGRRRPDWTDRDEEFHPSRARDRYPRRRGMESAFFGGPPRGTSRNPNPNPIQRVPPFSRNTGYGRRRFSDRNQYATRRTVSNRYEDDYYDDEGCYSDELPRHDFPPRRKYFRPTYYVDNNDDYDDDYTDSRSRYRSRGSYNRRRDRSSRRDFDRRMTTSRSASYYNRESRSPTRSRRTYADVVAGRYDDRAGARRGVDRYANESTSYRHVDEHRDHSDDRPANRRDERANRRRDNSDPPRAPAPDAKFARRIRMYYKTIRVCHHLENVSTIDDSKGPVMIRRTVDHLRELIRPAMPNPTTILSLENNARQWGAVTLEILEQHYSECLTTLLEDISKQKTDNWKTPFQVATRWATRNLMRLRQSTIDKAEKLIRARNRDRSPSSEEDDEEDDSSPPPPSSPPNSRRPKSTRDRDIADDDDDSDSASARRPPPSPPRPRKKSSKTTGAQTSVTHPSDQPPHTSSHHLQKFSEPSLKTSKKLYPLFNPPTTSSRIKKTKTSQQPHKNPSEPLPSTSRSITAPPLSPVEVPPSLIQTEDLEPLPQRSHRTRTHPVHRADSDSEGPHTVPESQFESSHSDAAYGVLPLSDENLSDFNESEQDDHRPTSVRDEADDAGALQDADEAQFADASDDPLLLTANRDDDPLPSHQPPSPKPLGKVNVHLPSSRKTSHWGLNINNKVLLIGDSNVANIPNFTLQEIQVESFAEATFRNIADVIQNSVSHTTVEILILALGFFNRKQNTKSTTIKQVQTALRNARATFSEAQIYIPLIHIPDNLPSGEKENLMDLNKYISDNHRHLTLIDPSHFQTRTDLLWKRNTAQVIFDHWMEQLNF